MTTYTENGAQSLATTGDERVDLFFKLVRNIPHDTLDTLIQSSWDCDPLDTMKILFQSRDCRNGKGDRMPFLHGMVYIAKHYPEWFIANISQISVFGRWLDYIELYHLCITHELGLHSQHIIHTIVSHIASTLVQDYEHLQQSKPVSLLAKWIPGEDKKWDQGFLKQLCVKLFHLNNVHRVSSWHYYTLRTKYITPLRNAIKLVETRMCTKTYNLIDYSAVPGIAMTKHKAAFTKHDTTRFAKYIADVKNNKSKINTGVVYPHTIVQKYLDMYDGYHYNVAWVDDVYETMWSALEKNVHIQDAVVVSDVSGSMHGVPLMVSIALGILLSSKNTSESFQNQLITFDTNPQFVDLGDCKTLLEKIIKVKTMQWGGSTDLQKTFDIILAKCLLGQEAAPKKLIILSDMQFNDAVQVSEAYRRTSVTNFEAIKNKFYAHNLEMPEIIFWNLRGDTDDFPVSTTTKGVTMLSGFSPTLLNSITTNVELTSYDILRQILDNPRYTTIVGV